MLQYSIGDDDSCCALINFSNDLKSGKNILVVAHGNSLRALIMKLDNLSKEEVVKLEIPTGEPIFYEFDNDMKVIEKKEL